MYDAPSLQAPQRSPLQRLRDFDRRRAGIPGEHAATAALGTWLVSAARRRQSLATRMLVLALGVGLLYRAASGRDGLARIARRRTGGVA